MSGLLWIGVNIVVLTSTVYRAENRDICMLDFTKIRPSNITQAIFLSIAVGINLQRQTLLQLLF